MGLNVEHVAWLLLIAAVVSLVARRLKMPYTVGLVVAGLLLALVPESLHVSLTKEMIFSVFLPPLIFEAAFQIRWHDLKRDLPLVGTMATLGVLVASAVTFFGIRWLLGWNWQPALLLSVLLAATDPVSVIATLEQCKVPKRLRLVVESESLLNDGTAAVLFSVALAATTGDSPTWTGITGQFAWTIAGGIGIGLAAGFLAMALIGRADDPFVEVVFTFVAAYGSFLIAEHFQSSGVFASLAAGLVLGNIGSTKALSDRGHEIVVVVWEFVAFVANSLVFLLIGLHLAERNFSDFLIPAAVVIGLVLLSRVVAVYGCTGLFAKSRWKLAWFDQNVLVCGGLRGALALALVLGLPDGFEKRETLVSVAFAVVAFSIIVQGFAVTLLLKRFAPAQPASEPAAG